MTHNQTNGDGNCSFNAVGIIGKLGESDISETIGQVIAVLELTQCIIYLDAATASSFPQYRQDSRHYIVCRESLVVQSDLIITIGGDGSFLAAARSALAADKPITGVNMGRLGFLTDISPLEVPTVLHQVLLGAYQHEARTVLFAAVERGGEVISTHTAINDVVIHKRRMARMVELDVYLDDLFLSSYRADGLIISSPTGSTAYALSSGGPILQGHLNSLVLVPISPHTLTHRPIVIAAETMQRIEVCENNDNNIQITVDGQEEVLLEKGDKIFITQHAKRLNIYHPQNYDGLKRLREKLGWGSAPQNT
ncbi:NAD(+) kinase [Ostreibacterium oceani]|uniref:NAD kinase n=1 Tax=Ostreibacterium oceani TaxID=2654998 RepID=A0A6N7EVK7_9GAMM|nr:NAD(+) kinase [Ostreibacterium oceani]MPV85459.1 NAD(+) kinase [Ostreibacterium oceani]